MTDSNREADAISGFQFTVASWSDYDTLVIEVEANGEEFGLATRDDATGKISFHLYPRSDSRDWIVDLALLGRLVEQIEREYAAIEFAARGEHSPVAAGEPILTST